MQNVASSECPTKLKNPKGKLFREFATRVSVAYYSDVLEIDRPTEIYTYDHELEYMRALKRVLEYNCFPIDMEIIRRYNYVMFAEKLKRLYNKALTAEENDEEDNPIRKEDYDELMSLKDVVENENDGMDQNSSLMLNIVETRYVLGESLSFANLITMNNIGRSCLYVVFENRSLKAVQTDNLRSDLLAIIKKHCQDVRIDRLEDIESPENFDSFIEACKDNGIIIITSDKGSERMDINLYCPEVISDFQRKKLLDIDIVFSISGEKNEDILNFIEQLRNEKMKRDEKGYKKVPRIPKGEETAH